MPGRRSVVILFCGGALFCACGLSVQGLAVATDDGGATPAAGEDSSASPEPAPDGAPALFDGSDRDAGGGAASDGGGAPDSGTPPLARTGLTFDGVNDFVRMKRPVADDFTLEAWIRTTASGTGPNFWDGPPVFHSDVNGANVDFGSSILGGKLAFGMGTPDLTVISGADVATGQWVHVAVTRVKGTGTVTLYVNGVQDTSRSGMSAASLDANPNMDIGANFNNSHFFNGAIDEVRAWRVVRTATQIQATMRLSLKGNEPDLVGYWRFDDGAGPTTIDSSPTKANGSLGDADASTRPTWAPSTAF